MDLSETVRKVMMLAGAKGYITFHQLDQMLPPDFRPEDIEDLMTALSENGICLQEE